jgi:two-component system nitrate/nitrite response regulator NarL
VLSASVSEHAAWQLARAGVHAIILKRHSSKALAEKIRGALRGEACSDAIYQRAIAERASSRSSTPWPELTERERNTLRLLIRGLGNKEIATEFRISEHAAKATIQRLFSKTGARTRGELVRIALQHYSHEL